jgi:hypothetical protein
MQQTQGASLAAAAACPASGCLSNQACAVYNTLSSDDTWAQQKERQRDEQR